MEIVVEIRQEADGHLRGNARTAGQSEGTPFWGLLELLALIEDLCRQTPGSTAPAGDHIEGSVQ